MEDYKKKYENLLHDIDIAIAGQKEGETKIVLQNLKERHTESEDESIRKWLIDDVKDTISSGHMPKEYEYMAKNAISWLEKQGKNEEINEASYRAGIKRVLDNPESYGLEKQSEQKPTDNVVEEEKPLLEKYKQAVYDCVWGKVTCKKEGETKEEYANRWAEQLLILVRDWADDYIDSREDAIIRRSFDKGKQSIQKPAWSGENSCYYDDICEILINLIHSPKSNVNKDVVQKDLDWLMSIKESQLKSAWSEEDKGNLLDVKCIIDEVWHNKYVREEIDYSSEELELLWNWLDNIWQRVEHPHNAWSEEDEKYYDSALWHIKRSSGREGSVYNWLKSLKERMKGE